jgi:hypothetical protein
MHPDPSECMQPGLVRVNENQVRVEHMFFGAQPGLDGVRVEHMFFGAQPGLDGV